MRVAAYSMRMGFVLVAVGWTGARIRRSLRQFGAATRWDRGNGAPTNVTWLRSGFICSVDNNRGHRDEC
jgi:hypothetical protein